MPNATTTFDRVTAVAAEYAERQGATVLARDAQTTEGTIGLVFLTPTSVLVFAETADFAEPKPDGSDRDHKRRSLRRRIAAYVESIHERTEAEQEALYRAIEIRGDWIAVDLDGRDRVSAIDHLERF